MQVLTADDAPKAAEDATTAKAPLSVLDQLRKAGENARRTRFFDMELPRDVEGGFGLRLGLPTVAGFTFSDDVAFLANNLNREIGDELVFLAHNVQCVVQKHDDEWVKVEGVTARDIAAAYAEGLTGAEVPVQTDDDAVRWLYSVGRPAQVNAHAATNAAKAYRTWAQFGDQIDPTVGQ